MIGCIWYLAWVFLLTVAIRGALHMVVGVWIRRVPEMVGPLQDVERYGWWLSLVLAAVVSAAVF